MSEAKRIAKNTFLLYIRMFFSMLVGLYTSRVMLNALGIENYGIYSLVGSVVILFSFLNSALSGATQRFLNYQLGKNNEGELIRTFSMSLNLHVILAVGILLICEIAGTWLIYTKLNIPVERLTAAYITFQFSILTFLINILTVPYNATIIAYEKMKFYAYLSIVDVFLKLMIVYLLLFSPFDKLVLYAILLFCVQCVVSLSYILYCIKKIRSVRYEKYWNNNLFKKMFSYTGWTLLSSASNIARDQGISIVMNSFIGVTANAALGITDQVCSNIYKFVSNFQIAYQPGLVKDYASGNLQQMYKIIVFTTKTSYFLLFLLVVPIYFNIESILTFWLGDYPVYSPSFIRCILLFLLIDCISGPFWTTIGATGKMKMYSISMSLILFSNIPIAYLFLYLNLFPDLCLYYKAFTSLLLFILRIYLTHRYVGFSYNQFWKHIFPYIVFPTIVTISIYIFVIEYFVENAVLKIAYALLLSGISVIVGGFTKYERNNVYKYIKMKCLK